MLNDESYAGFSSVAVGLIDGESRKYHRGAFASIKETGEEDVIAACNHAGFDIKLLVRSLCRLPK